MGRRRRTVEVERKVWRDPREGREVEGSETTTGAVTIESGTGRETGIASGRETEERGTIRSDTTRKKRITGSLRRQRSERKASEYRKIPRSSRRFYEF